MNGDNKNAFTPSSTSEKDVKSDGEKIPQWAQDLKNQNEALQKKVDMFEDLAGKNAIASWKEGQKDNKDKYASFKIWNEKIIVSWGKLDYSKFNYSAKKPREENVFSTVNYMDGSEEKINYVDFVNIKEFVSAKILKVESEFYEVEFNREELDKQGFSPEKLKEIQKKQRINIKFLNA